MNEDAFAALLPVVAACEELGIRYFVSGSLASSLHGTPRATNDVDLVAGLTAAHAEPLQRLLGDAYYIDARMIVDGLRRGIPSNLIHLATMVKVDLHAGRSMPFGGDAMERAREERIEDWPRPIRFATPEDMILAKLSWYRAGGGHSERQWNDLLGILRVQGEGLDEAYLGRWLGRLEVEDLYRRLRTAAG